MEKDLIIKALECCANNDECVGEACPYYATGCEKQMPKDALSLIKELTEENERLKQDKKILELQIEAKERICESYMLQYGTVADKEVWLKKEREGTIQKYREQLHRAFAHSDSKDKFNKGVFLKAVDQIAKEMEESVDEG